jgi:hypothetical protein
MDVSLIDGIPEDRQFVVVLAHNEADDRWVFKPVNFEAEYHPLITDGQDMIGVYINVACNHGTVGFLDEICSALGDDVWEAHKKRHPGPTYYNSADNVPDDVDFFHLSSSQLRTDEAYNV